MTIVNTFALILLLAYAAGFLEISAGLMFVSGDKGTKARLKRSASVVLCLWALVWLFFTVTDPFILQWDTQWSRNLWEMEGMIVDSFSLGEESGPTGPSELDRVMGRITMWLKAGTALGLLLFALALIPAASKPAWKAAACLLPLAVYGTWQDPLSPSGLLDSLAPRAPYYAYIFSISFFFIVAAAFIRLVYVRKWLRPVLLRRGGIVLGLALAATVTGLAVYGLARTPGDSWSVPELIAAAKSSDDWVSQRAAKELGLKGEKALAAVPVLARLYSGDGPENHSAYRALFLMGEAAVTALEELLGSDDPATAKGASRVLRRMDRLPE